MTESPTPPPTPGALELLDALVAACGGEAREGQRTLVTALEAALTDGRHLVAEAPTGIGKTFAIAAAVAAWHGAPPAPDEGRTRRVVIATATKALQDQLVDEDLPRMASVAEARGVPFTAAVLKGRSNYLCLARTAEAAGTIVEDDRTVAAKLVAAADEAGSGERSALPTVRDSDWDRLSVSSVECPGARDCSQGEHCWAERARHAAGTADVVVVNSALYAAHLMSDGAVLPRHDAVVVDEAHALPDILVDAGTAVVGASRCRAIERLGRRWATAAGSDAPARLSHAADGLAGVLDGLEGEVDPTNGDLAVHLAEARAAATDLVAVCKQADEDDARQAGSAAANLAADLAALAAGASDDQVVWCERDGRLHRAPIDASGLGGERLWPETTVVCLSATLRAADAEGTPTFAPFLASLGAPPDVTTLAVPTPFDFARQGLLYVPRGRIPSPRQPGWAEGVADELWHLAAAARGRTLALFTSRAATERAADELRRRADEAGTGLEVLTQWDSSRPRLVAALRTRRNVVLCATRSFWTGIDIPGDACVVVAIDRVPFPRPDDPLINARRRRAEAAGDDAFATVDLTAAALQLAQGVGRLIRSPHDRGVVAVLDTRLATAAWRRRILGALPPFRRTVRRDEVEAFLAES